MHPAGQIDQVNQLETRSYHCGDLNGESVGVCVAGDFTEAMPASEQIESVGRLVTELEVEARPRTDRVGARRCASDKLPGRHVRELAAADPDEGGSAGPPWVIYLAEDK